MSRKRSGIRLGLTRDGFFDELVVPLPAPAHIHFEMMHDSTLWFGIYFGRKGKSIHGTISTASSRGRLRVMLEGDDVPIQHADYEVAKAKKRSRRC